MQEEKTKDYLEGAFYGIPMWVVWVCYFSLAFSASIFSGAYGNFSFSSK